jgi:membrane protease YdiL (CAAX protease family)
VPRPFIIFTVLFALAELVKVTHRDVLWAIIDGVLAIFFVIACAVTKRCTSQTASDNIPDSKRRVSLQLVSCAVVFFATMFDAPGWNVMRQGIFDAAARYVSEPYANGIANFTTYCIPIAAVLLLLGVRPAQMGLGKFARGSMKSAITWLVLPLGIFAWALIAGKLTMPAIAAVWLSNLLQNGVSEEFLWRGAILGRLRTIMTPSAAIVLQALLFGAWHLHADAGAYHGAPVTTVAEMIASQALFGVAAGYVTLRTGNIAIASAFHLLFDSLQVFQ